MYEMLRELSDRIRSEGFKPDVIVGISRRGWFPARILSDLLDNRCIASVGAKFHVGVYETSREPRLTQPIMVDVFDKRILLVDVTVDTGKSAVLIKGHTYLGKESRKPGFSLCIINRGALLNLTFIVRRRAIG